MAALMRGIVAISGPMPTRATEPPFFVHLMAAVITESKPTQSMLPSTSSPSLSALIFSATSSAGRPFVSRVTMFGLSDCRKANRSGRMSHAMIRFAPRPLATRAQIVPMGPAPNTATDSPGNTFAFSVQAYTPTDSGSHRAPSSSVMLSGSLKQ
eukprot:gene4153-biopygen4084